MDQLSPEDQKLLMEARKQRDMYQNLSPEDRKILEDAHNNRQNPQHPAHPEHHKHGEWLKALPKQLVSAAMFGAGATFGADMVNKALGR